MGGPRTDLTSVRLLLASAVIASHSFAFVKGWEPGLLGVPLGSWAVIGFFVLSGNLITASWRADPNIGRFATRRALRIVPGFVVAFLVCVLIVAPAFGVQAPPREFIRMLGLQAPDLAPFHASHDMRLNGSMWTIFWEVVCYAAVPITFRVFANRRFFAAVWLVLAALSIARPDALLIRLMLAFLTGAALTGVRFPPLRLPRLPDISYGTYLYGWPIQGVVVSLGVRDPWTLFALALPLSLAAGWVSYRLVERPAMRLRPGSARAAVAVA
jgi:peptidoglycan/LPS O-acetylase OafA/YrhL